jgi:uncharacterized protein YkwD
MDIATDATAERAADSMNPPSGISWRRVLLTVLAIMLAAVLFAVPSFGTTARTGPRPPATHPVRQQVIEFQPQQLTTNMLHRWANRMMDRLNRQRHRMGRAPLHMNAKLSLSAHRHDLRMARRNLLSHQLPGEAYFADRISRTGYRWRSVGENIGWTSDRSLNGLLALEDAMFHEKPPNNGHRLNIINRTFRDVGIDVYWDRTHHKLWFTQDFGQPA